MIQIKKLIAQAFAKLSIQEEANVSVSSKPDIADYTCNSALALAKYLKKNPLQLAQEIVANIPSQKDFTFSVVNPGFINVKLNYSFLVNNLDQPISSKSEKVIIDYGSPNVAKGMHVGHLRSALIGQCLYNLYKHQGYNVESDNHLGDWGTPLGIVITKIQEVTDMVWDLDSIEKLYVEGSIQYKDCPEFEAKVQATTYKLQNGDIETITVWKKVIEVTKQQLLSDYAKMNISFDQWLGESFFEPIIPDMVKELSDKGLVQESEGAKVIQLDSETPLVLVKTNGSYLYHTTDLACLKYRHEAYDKILYVVDSRQSFHFDQLFKAGLKVGYLKANQAEHVKFGTINGKDGKPFKTRQGGVLKLKDLIEIMNQAALAKLEELGNDYTSEEIADICPKIAQGALKFSELCHNRISDYIFDPDKFTAFEGYTGPYVMYSAIRAKSILNKTSIKGVLKKDHVPLEVELKILLKLYQSQSVLERAVNLNEPHTLCEYAFELSNLFNSFYSQQKVLGLADKEFESHYLALTEKVHLKLKEILNILGIELPNKM